MVSPRPRPASLDGVAETTSRIADRGRQRHGAARRATAAWRYGFAPRADVDRCREARRALHLAQPWILNLRRCERHDVMTYLLGGAATQRRVAHRTAHKA